VFHYFYDYGQSSVSRALFLLTAVAEPVTRSSIAELLRTNGAAVAPDLIDDELTLLASFGILDQSTPGSYRIPGSYLPARVAVRDVNRCSRSRLRRCETKVLDDPA